MVLSFLVDKQIITRVDKEKVVRDSMNYLYANFEFSPDWTGQKTAVFKSKSGAFNVLLDDDGKCLVPWEVLQDEVIEISVFCGALITANVVKIITLASGYTIGEEGREPTPDVYTQIMEKLSEIEAEVDPEALQALIDAYLADKDYVTEADVETIVAAYVDEHKSEWQGSEVEVTPVLSSGTKIAEIDVDGTTTNLYAPNGGGGATALDDLTDVSLTTPQSGDVLVYDGEKWGNSVIDGYIPKGNMSELIPAWSQYWFDRKGDTWDTPITDGVATEKLLEKGLYIVTFPDELTATYTIDDYVDHNTRRYATSFHPFSIFIRNDGDLFRVGVKRKDGGTLSVSDAIMNDVHVYLVKGAREDSDITVAPSDGYPDKKEIASIVLDGTNDTRILCALFACYNGINVLLYNGTYNINEMWTYSNTAKIAITFNDYQFDGGSRWRRYVNVHGESISTVQAVENVKFVVSQALHESLNSTGANYFIIGSPYDYSNEQITRAATALNLKNINIIGYKYDKPITYVDTTRCYSTMIESVNVRSWAKDILAYAPFDDTPNAECCGIRIGRGSNGGFNNSVKHLNVWYCGKGIACNGEHFIFEDVKTHHNYIGWVFGDRYTVGAHEHPNILIGCSIEGCYRLMTLSINGEATERERNPSESKATLVMIGTSTEAVWDIPINERTQGGATNQKTLPIKEIVKSLWRGRIEIDWSGDLFESGDGGGFTVTKYN